MVSLMKILAKDIDEPLELSDCFYENKKSFYLYIASYAASDGDANEQGSKPLRFHKVENMIDCIFSPNMSRSFYNAILNTDICNTIEQHHRNDKNQIMERILSLVHDYNCPVLVHVKPAALATQELLKRYRFLELLQQSDDFLYMDFDGNDTVLKSDESKFDIKIYELDDLTQADSKMRKLEWGYVLCASFGFRNPEIHGPFYSDVWSRVEVGPTKPVRMFIALKNDRVVGGCHLSLSCGIACLFNLVTLKNERGQGIGKALSLTAMKSARELNYRYLVLQASAMGAPIYKKLGFRSLPSYKTFIKLPTAIWYYKIIELVLTMLGMQRIQQLMDIVRKISKNFLAVTMIMMIIVGILIVKIFK
ncbi:unnamed protein product [Rotaria magnacalcarata]|uniref:N-acetyltransferase domain-containing protein n=3 Tax=Rotaria magnacalcarata TaxID=392030 RepID=A0A814SZ30_9BILA|nr:unnamed protein product [Rotaria magnacalcarata]CAF1629875.1 unnamed protein product [Rotaria magnacalcarata]CAF2207616.1 unnamed protein product [Rotaria magnacalcarata]CAF4017947.1 unnamed protein product [Rotaria magnacalcarata]CAF4173417.1 unnamed protein product [Rotaria magnacalcarata]